MTLKEIMKEKELNFSKLAMKIHKKNWIKKIQEILNSHRLKNFENKFPEIHY